MTEALLPYVEAAAAVASVWGLVLILVLMTVESSFIPFPSEVVMIPAGFLAARQELPPGEPIIALALAVLCGLTGSMLGAFFNYYLSLRLGRPLLYRYGKWFLLSPATLERAEEIFREYGDVATLVSRLLPGIRQLISIPAGLARMELKRFALYTALGAGTWVAILAGLGFALGRSSAELSYAQLLERGSRLLHDQALWILLGCALLVVGWIVVHRRVIGAAGPRQP